MNCGLKKIAVCNRWPGKTDSTGGKPGDDDFKSPQMASIQLDVAPSFMADLPCLQTLRVEQLR